MRRATSPHHNAVDMHLRVRHNPIQASLLGYCVQWLSSPLSLLEQHNAKARVMRLKIALYPSHNLANLVLRNRARRVRHRSLFAGFSALLHVTRYLRRWRLFRVATNRLTATTRATEYICSTLLYEDGTDHLIHLCFMSAKRTWTGR